MGNELKYGGFSDALLERYLAGDLGSERRAEIEQACTEQPALRSRLEAMRQSSEAFLAADPPAAFAHRLATQLAVEAAAAEPARNRRWLFILGPSAAAAATLVVVLAVVVPDSSPLQVAPVASPASEPKAAAESTAVTDSAPSTVARDAPADRLFEAEDRFQPAPAKPARTRSAPRLAKPSARGAAGSGAPMELAREVGLRDVPLASSASQSVRGDAGPSSDLPIRAARVGRTEKAKASARAKERGGGKSGKGEMAPPPAPAPPSASPSAKPPPPSPPADVAADAADEDRPAESPRAEGAGRGASREAVVAAVREIRPRLVACVRAAVAAGELVAGRFEPTASWVIERDGSVGAAVVAKPEAWRHLQLGRCFERELGRMRFGAAGQATPVRNFPIGPIVVD